MNIAVIFAGGSGKRMRSRDIPKQFLRVHGKPIIIHTLSVWEKHPDIDAIVIACIEEGIDELRGLVKEYGITKVKKIVPGGSTGQLSIYQGLLAAENVSSDDEADDTIVYIHDGVRPFINDEVISNNIRCVKEHGSSITTVKVKETILVVDEEEKIVQVPDRNVSRLARAPQSFYLKDILAAHKKAVAEGKTDFIDSCTLMQYYGYKLYMTDGPDENIKITTPEDFFAMQSMLNAKENEQIYGL